MIPMRTQTRPTGNVAQMGLLLGMLASGVSLAAPAVAQPRESKPTNVGKIKLVTRESSFGKVPLFSPDSRHVAYAGGNGGKGGHGWFVVDGQKSEAYDNFRGFRFESSDTIRAIAYRLDESFNKVLLSVEIRIVEE